MRTPSRKWNAVQVAAMRDRLAAGATTREVGQEFGCSRNAVISLVHRRQARPERREMSRADAAPKPSSRQRTPRSAAAPVPVEARLLCEVDEMPAGDGVRIVDLRARHCRWVVAPGAPWVFCGAYRERGSYCGTHAALVYTKEQS